MIEKDLCLKAIKAFRIKHGVEASDENTIATIHLMNAHGVDLHAAQDQSSRSGNDHGIDAWYYSDEDRELYVYQSKLSESRSLALSGLSDLSDARLWLEQLIIEGTVDVVPSDNQCLYNLYLKLSKERATIRKIDFRLITLFNENELEDNAEYDEFVKLLVASPLNAFIQKERNGKLAIELLEYDLEGRVPGGFKTYPITKIPETRLYLRQSAHLDLAYVPLYSLVELYRQRGNVLFDKNVRLSIIGKKQARDRLVHPLESTLDMITSGEVSPNIFPFYHVGVTIAATTATDAQTDLLTLAAPSIINGCQTITIANEYFKRLERSKKDDAIARFKQIKVIAKVVVGTTDEELKEITNANNRQNPIENWQLFSNDSIHIAIEYALKDVGIFYERQAGKFDSLMKNADTAKHYPHTNGTSIAVERLGQIIALIRGQLSWGAKPSEIFLNKESHDKIFDRTAAKCPRDAVFCVNVHMASRRGLERYLWQPSYANSNALKIFVKPMIRAHLFRLAILYFYQHDGKDSERGEYSRDLLKKASKTLVEQMEGFYLKVVSKTKNWYLEESKNLEIDVSKKSMDSFFSGLETELGIDFNDGCVPFSAKSIDWTQYDEEKV